MPTFGIVDNSCHIVMVLYPRAKINLGLYVTNKRSDGYHDIETLFYPVGICDILEFQPDESLEADELVMTGLVIPGKPDTNLVLQACAAFRKRVELPFFRIHLHKQIPMGAGLGGGSSDAATMLQGLHARYGMEMSMDELATIALEIGSDCPFFLLGEPAIGRGRGEKLSPFPLDLSPYWLVLFNPGLHVSTREAYAGVTLQPPVVSLEELLQKPVGQWRGQLHNVFEDSVFRLYPDIRMIKEALYDSGAVYASMSGSGSAVYGLFNEKPGLPPEIERIKIHEGSLG